jgi:hypothetical protein
MAEVFILIPGRTSRQGTTLNEGKFTNGYKAWALMVRHSPGVALPNRTFIYSEEMVRAPHEAVIRFSELSQDVDVA